MLKLFSVYLGEKRQMNKFAFATCVRLGLDCLEAIYKMRKSVEFIVTLNDDKDKNKSGRVYLDDFAKKHNIPLIKINNINEDKVINALKEYNIDYFFVIGWSQIAKSNLLGAANKGCIGMHPTLLPEGRGRAAIPWAIIKGLKYTGVTMFKLDVGVDTGDIIGQERIKLSKTINSTKLYDKIAKLHVKLMRKNFTLLEEDKLIFKKQDDALATVWEGRKPEDGEMFSTMTIKQADRHIRALTRPYPGAFIRRDNDIIKIWSAKKSIKKGDIKFKDGYIILKEYEVIKYD